VPFLRSGFASCEHELMFAGHTDVQGVGEEAWATDTSLGWSIPGL
jgi:acetylornithine deacetylase/succinyl-diaminopimelate desuccinylase-like protein